MDLSQPNIAIRERTILEIFDLTLHVYRDHFRNILLLLVINILPLTISNAVIVHLLIGSGDALPSEQLAILLLLIISQAQAGTLLITQYLGTATFSGRPTIKSTIADFLKAPKYWIWSHGFIRMVIPILLVLGFFQHDGFGFSIFLIMFALVIRAFRPFISEILVLEQPPRKIPKDSATQQITLKRRAKDLHRGDVLVGFFMSILVGSCLLVTISSLFFHLDSAIGLNGDWDLPIHFIYWPLSAWLVVSFLAVFRFLYYINTRITQEGWEIALKLMAEKQKLFAGDDY